MFSLRTRASRETCVRPRVFPGGAGSILGAKLRWDRVENGLNEGIRVCSVLADSPAAEAGLEEGDFILTDESSHPCAV